MRKKKDKNVSEEIAIGRAPFIFLFAVRARIDWKICSASSLFCEIDGVIINDGHKYTRAFISGIDCF